MTQQRNYGGSSGTPIEYPKRASAQRQTEEGRYRQPPRKQPVTTDDEDGDAWTVEKPHTSAVRYDRLPRREATLLPEERTRVISNRRFDTGRLLTFIGLVMLFLLLGYVALSWLRNWWTTTTNDWTYGRPRTFQVDHVVGHNDSAEHPSHFIAMNLDRHVIVIEIPGGDASKAQIYLGPVLVGDGQDLTPVTLTFDDRNGDGKPDLNIHIGDQVIVFLNDGKKLVPAPQQQ